jgi:hypothetical protein
VSLAISDVPDPASEFTFARVEFTMNVQATFQREAPWHHDYPYSEDLYLTMLKEVTGVSTSKDSYKIVHFNDPDIFQFPFLYVSEPGFMNLTESEVKGLRAYLDRGGFVMFDDFRGRDLLNLQRQMKLVYPDRDMVRLDVSHEIFHSFYDIETLDMQLPYGGDGSDPRFGTAARAEFWAMKDDEDRVIMIANHNNDFGEFWEWVDRGEMPFQPAAQSVRFGINYLIYAMTH